MAKRDRNQRPIVIVRREEGGEHGHHGGAWKIAYADFVTAMMAFFLLMWLINATTDAQRVGLADYFAPTNILSRGSSGSGEPFGGRTLNTDQKLAGESPPVTSNRPPSAATMARPREDDETMEEEAPADRQAPRRIRENLEALSAYEAARNPLADRGANRGEFAAGQPSEMPTDATGQTEAGNAPPSPAQAALQALVVAQQGPAAAAAQAAAQAAQQGGQADGQGQGQGQGQAGQMTAQQARAALDRAAQEIRAAIQADPQVADLARQLLIEQTREGLRIQLVDADGQPVFSAGQAAPNARGRALLLQVARVVARLPNGIDISGHTDATPFRGGGDRSNWELSSERASAARRLLIDAGIGEERLRAVAGRADRDLLLKDRPTDPTNRRVSVLVLMPATAPRGFAP
ncbi:flagellar motor protein MotB [Roseomonas sp. 18066]|uniref:flagellar motor protein MotB n=1 Tax=Roseomonas sp. 18066 TaxID=2681412 RepID=UPI0013585723|nr:flagellar motor protein MotB [Roseomonas sp. 18066]